MSDENTPGESLPDLLTFAEAADLLGVPKSQLRFLKQNGAIVPKGRTSGTRYRRADVEALRHHRPRITKEASRPTELKTEREQRIDAGRTCKCGCGTEVRPEVNYAQGHYWKVKAHLAVAGGPDECVIGESLDGWQPSRG